MRREEKKWIFSVMRFQKQKLQCPQFKPVYAIWYLSVGLERNLWLEDRRQTHCRTQMHMLPKSKSSEFMQITEKYTHYKCLWPRKKKRCDDAENRSLELRWIAYVYELKSRLKMKNEWNENEGNHESNKVVKRRQHRLKSKMCALAAMWPALEGISMPQPLMMCTQHSLLPSLCRCLERGRTRYVSVLVCAI